MNIRSQLRLRKIQMNTKRIWLWLFPMTLIWPGIHILIFIIRFGQLSPDVIRIIPIFIPMSLISGLLFLFLWRLVRTRSQKIFLIIGYLIACPIAYFGSLFSGLALPALVGTLIWGAGPLVAGILIGFALGWLWNK